MTPLQLALAAVFAGLVFVATYSFVISIPATGGYFNLGEIVIYVAAIVFGPIVGGIAGAGAAISDALVAPQFAPGTLVIKVCEGAIVGYLAQRGTAKITRAKWRVIAPLLGVGVGALLAITGALNLSGQVQLGITDPPITLFVPPELWYVAGAVAAVLIIYASLKVDPHTGWSVFSIIPGGLTMVLGYFLYESLVLGSVTAVFEVPANIGQMLIGLIVAVPIAHYVFRSFPQLKSQTTPS